MMQDDTPIRCWEYFDKIYCISLDERTDRRAEAESQFRSVGLGERVEFFFAKKHPHNCEQGLFESHIACIKKGIKSGAETILISSRVPKQYSYLKTISSLTDSKRAASKIPSIFYRQVQTGMPFFWEVWFQGAKKLKTIQSLK